MKKHFRYLPILVLIFLLDACTATPPPATPTALPSATIAPSSTITPVPPSATPSSKISLTPQNKEAAYIGTPFSNKPYEISINTIHELAILAKYNLLDNKSFNYLSFSPNGTHLYTLNQDIDIPSNQYIIMSDLPEEIQETYELKIASSGETIPYDNIPENLINKVNQPFEAFSFHIKENVNKTFFFPDDHHLILCLSNGKIWFINVLPWIPKLIEGTYQLAPDLVINTGEGSVKNIYVSPDNSRIIIMKQNHELQIWDTTTLTKLKTFTNLPWPVRIALSPNNQLFAISTSDQVIRIYNLETIELLHQYHGHAKPILGLVFSPDGKYLASMDTLTLNLWGIPDIDNAENQEPVNQSNHEVLSTVVLPAPTVLPTSAIVNYRDIFPLSWPIDMPSIDQIEEVNNCAVEDMAQIRYPEELDYFDLESNYQPETACDWAILSIAYINHGNHFAYPREEGKRAFAQSIKLNPAFAFVRPVYEHYFGQINLVEAPQFTEKNIQSVKFTYHFFYDIGDAPIYHYDILLTRVENKELFKADIDLQVDGISDAKTGYIDAALINKLNTSMTDLVPINDPGKQLEYTDNGKPYPITITYEDGSEITIGNFFPDWCPLIGPRLIKIDDVNYVQYSNAFLEALNQLSPYFDLPYDYKFINTCIYPILD